MSSLETTAIVIAAGLGSRLRPHTDASPKCMLPFGKSTILQSQIDVFNENGISDMAIIRGYMGEKINYPGIRYYENDNYNNNNILNSLFFAEDEINGHTLISYSDIVFESQVVSTLLKSDGDITIVVDVDWKGYYEGRLNHPINEAEAVVFDENYNVREIGKILSGHPNAPGEFIGMLKLTPKGADIFKSCFHAYKEKYWGKPFQRAATFEKAYITDMIQEMVDSGISVSCALIKQGWKEIDTVEDYEKAIQALEG